MDEGGLAAGAIVLCVCCLRCAIAVCAGAPTTRAGCTHASAMVGGALLLGAICGAGGHGAKVGKLYLTLKISNINTITTPCLTMFNSPLTKTNLARLAPILIP